MVSWRCWLNILAGNALLTACSDEPTAPNLMSFEPAVALAEREVVWRTEEQRLIAEGQVGDARWPMLTVRCRGRSSPEVEILGFIPAQAFPQPPISLTVGQLRHETSLPTAIYKPGRRVFPKHPPLAILRFDINKVAPFLAALQTEAPIGIRFRDQTITYPEIPRPVLNSFVEACEAAPSGGGLDRQDSSARTGT